jgi:hypothetical protein
MKELTPFAGPNGQPITLNKWLLLKTGWDGWEAVRELFPDILLEMEEPLTRSGGPMTAEKSPSTTPGDASSTSPLPEALERHLGHDPVLQWLARAGHPLTVENYVNFAWLGELPAELEPDQQELLDALAEYEANQQRR